MESQKLVSVIIPAYNAEKTIANIIKALLNQTYHQIEIIVINDGSTDRTEEICRQFSDRITLITTSNKGQGSARNTGIEIAKGQYIGFCDSDDDIEPDMYENLVRMIKQTNSDMVGCGHSDIISGDLIIHESNDKAILNKKQALSYFAEQKGIKWAVWDKLFSKDKIGNIRFRTERLHAEDCLFILDFIIKNNTFYYEDLGKYHYRRDNKDSFTKRKWNRSQIGLTFFYKSLYETLKQYDVLEQLNKIQTRYFENLLSTFIRSKKYGYNDMNNNVYKLMKNEQSNIWDAPDINLLFKLDFYICCKYHFLASIINFWYK